MRLGDVAPVNPPRDLGLIRDQDEVAFVPMASVSELSGKVDLAQRRPAGSVRSGFTRFRSGDVIFAKITPCMENGKLAVVPKLPFGVGAGSTEFHVMEPLRVHARYLFHWLSQETFRNRAEQNMSGSAGQKRVPADWLRSAPIPIPDKDSAQGEIVSRIDALFAEIDEGEAALAEARAGVETYRKSLLKSAVTGELTADWRRENPPRETGPELLQRILTERRTRWKADPKNVRKKYVEPKGPEIRGWPALPEGWGWATIEQLSSSDPGAISDGPFGSNLKSEHYRNSGARVIRLQNIGKDGVFVDVSAHIDEGHFASLQRHHVRTGDIIVAILGDPLPRAVILPADIGLALVKADCIKVRLSSGVATDFVWAWLNSVTVQNHFINDIKGVGRPRIGMAQIKSLPVPIAPTSEMAEVVSRTDKALSLISSMLASHSERVMQVGQLRQSILAAAFKGELNA